MTDRRPGGVPPEHPARAPYRDAAVADAYAKRRFAAGTGRSTDRRERRVLEELLATTGLGPGARVLDCPAGAGRMSNLLAARGFRVVAADQSPAMLVHAARALAATGRGVGAVAADAAALPFRPGSFDLVLCHRLLHHFAGPEERHALLRALREATGRWALVSWFDAVSLQHLRRAMRRPFRSSGRHALRAAVLERECAAAGFRVRARRALRPFVSELTFTLLEAAP